MSGVADCARRANCWFDVRSKMNAYINRKWAHYVAKQTLRSCVLHMNYHFLFSWSKITQFLLRKSCSKYVCVCSFHTVKLELVALKLKCYILTEYYRPHENTLHECHILEASMGMQHYEIELYKPILLPFLNSYYITIT